MLKWLSKLFNKHPIIRWGYIRSEIEWTDSPNTPTGLVLMHFFSQGGERWVEYSFARKAGSRHICLFAEEHLNWVHNGILPSERIFHRTYDGDKNENLKSPE